MAFALCEIVFIFFDLLLAQHLINFVQVQVVFVESSCSNYIRGIIFLVDLLDDLGSLKISSSSSLDLLDLSDEFLLSSHDLLPGGDLLSVAGTM